MREKNRRGKKSIFDDYLPISVGCFFVVGPIRIDGVIVCETSVGFVCYLCRDLGSRLRRPRTKWHADRQAEGPPNTQRQRKITLD